MNNSEEYLPEPKFIGCETVYDSNLCRVCLSKGDHKLSEISANQTSLSPLSHLEMMMACVPTLQVAQGDPYPQNICNECSKRLEQSYQFHLLCIETDQRLRQPIEVKIEIDEFDKMASDGEPEMIKTDGNINVKLESMDEHQIKPKRFRQKVALRDTNGKYIRIRKYKQKPNHKCDICGKMMFGNVALEQHVRTHTGEKPFICELCGKSYRTRGCIKRHLESHNLDRPKKFNCTRCAYRTDRSSVFKRHEITVHSNARPFQCEICKGKFKSEVILRNHMERIHLRSFPCHLCADKFTSNRGLQIHVKIHYSPNQYRCPECKKLYGRFGSLKYHLNKHHPELKRPKPEEVLVEDADGIKK